MNPFRYLDLGLYLKWLTLAKDNLKVRSGLAQRWRSGPWLSEKNFFSCEQMYTLCRIKFSWRHVKLHEMSSQFASELQWGHFRGTRKYATNSIVAVTVRNVILTVILACFEVRAFDRSSSKSVFIMLSESDQKPSKESEFIIYYKLWFQTLWSWSTVDWPFLNG